MEVLIKTSYAVYRMELIHEINRKQKNDLLDYKWTIRQYVAKHKHHLRPEHDELIYQTLSPFMYLSFYHDQIKRDKSLNAICQLCNDISHVTDTEFPDLRLHSLAQMFNDLIGSDRTLLMCYDCGTVARAVLFQLIKTYRGSPRLKHGEITRIKDDYYMTRYQGSAGVQELREHIKLDHDPRCLYLCAMQLGDDFGHIYVVEKMGHRYRIYQSCLGAYLLIDYIEHMNYAEDTTRGVDIDSHLDCLEQLFASKTWDHNKQDLFAKWFHFTPPAGPAYKDKKLFTFTYVDLP